MYYKQEVMYTINIIHEIFEAGRRPFRCRAVEPLVQIETVHGGWSSGSCKRWAMVCEHLPGKLSWACNYIRDRKIYWYRILVGANRVRTIQADAKDWKWVTKYGLVQYLLLSGWRNSRHLQRLPAFKQQKSSDRSDLSSHFFFILIFDLVLGISKPAHAASNWFTCELPDA